MPDLIECQSRSMYVSIEGPCSPGLGPEECSIFKYLQGHLILTQQQGLGHMVDRNTVESNFTQGSCPIAAAAFQALWTWYTSTYRPK